MTPTLIDKPGVYDLAADSYHADPVKGGSLSSTGARKLLPPSCPALYRYWADHPEQHRRVFDFGQAAHAEILGIGRPIAVLNFDNYRKKAAQDARDDAHAAGEIPLLADEYAQVQAMADALRAHPIASVLLDPESGRGEQSLIWRDKPSGVWRRAMLDWLPDPHEGRLIIPDYKTAVRAEPAALGRTMHSYGYAQQADWYLAAVEALGLAGELDPVFVFIFQEKTPPYLVTVAQPDPPALLWGRRLNQEAIATYRHCTATGQWPGYSETVVSLELPFYATRQLEDAWERGDLSAYTDEDAA